MDQLRIDPHEINRVLALPRFYGQNEWDYRYLYRQGGGDLADRRVLTLEKLLVVRASVLSSSSGSSPCRYRYR
jgi:hypothetical protein